MAIGYLAQKSGSLATSIFMTLPVVAGPSFIFLAFKEEQEFLATAALYTFAFSSLVFIFTSVFTICIAYQKSYYKALATTSILWGILSSLMQLIEQTLLTSIILVISGFVISELIKYKGFSKIENRTAITDSSASNMLIRSMTAGLVVGSAVTFSKLLGPAVTAMLVSYPSAIVTSSWILSRTTSLEFAGLTLSHARLGVISYASFCFMIAVLFSKVQSTYALGIAFIISGLMSALIYFFKRRNIQRTI